MSLPPALNAAQVLERQARSDDLHPRLQHGRVDARSPDAPSGQPESSAASPRGTGLTREASGDLTEQHEGSRPRTEEPSSEALFVQASELAYLYDSEVAALMAAFMQKRMQKELPPTGSFPGGRGKLRRQKALSERQCVGSRRCACGKVPKPERSCESIQIAP